MPKAQTLQRIAELYSVEADIRGQPPDIRCAQRLARASPLLQEMHSWLISLVGRVSAKSELAQAIGYSLACWKALTRYVDDGRIEIDNNAAERALRGVALGRCNYLFMGSDAGGQRRCKCAYCLRSDYAAYTRRCSFGPNELWNPARTDPRG